MMHLSHISNVVLVSLVAAFFLLASGQTLHTMLLAMQRKPAKANVAAIVYEALIAGHLMLACCTACEAAVNHGAMLIRLRSTTVAIEPLLWTSLAIACLGLALAFIHHKLAMAPEIALLALCSPPAIDVLGQHAIYLFIADAAFFAFRVSLSLAYSTHHVSSSVTKLSIVDALDKLPEGVVWANEKRRILYMNDAMRARLTALGFSTDLSETSGLWTQLGDISRRQGMPFASQSVRIELPTGQLVLFTRDSVNLRGSTCWRMTAIDVTEEESINAEIAQMNGLLEAANRELRESLAHVQEVARNEALVRMKARVHDTIGQRLSILHRFLEAENPSAEALAEVARLTRGIVDDLSQPVEPDSASQLSSIVRAFSLSNVTVNIQGTLSESPSEADALVRIVREAATNAVKHARAQHIDVRLFPAESPIAMSISNDGAPATSVIVLGNGIPGMQRAAAEAGLEFRIASRCPFTIEIQRPHNHTEFLDRPIDRSIHD